MTDRSQHPDELAAFLALLTDLGARSYLEIGARYGATFRQVALTLPVPSRLVAIDLPGGPWGVERSRGDLEYEVAEANRRGHRARVIFGDSHALTTRERLGFDTFDVVFIDGDHRYEGVARDFALYGPLATKAVIFHDIVGTDKQDRAGRLVEVPRFWQELVAAHPDRTREIVAPGSVMGLGILTP